MARSDDESEEDEKRERKKSYGDDDESDDEDRDRDRKKSKKKKADRGSDSESEDRDRRRKKSKKKKSYDSDSDESRDRRRKKKKKRRYSDDDDDSYRDDRRGGGDRGYPMDGSRDVAPGNLHRRPFNGASRLYVGNLPYTMTTDQLRDHFSSFGRITDCIVKADQATGRSRGFGIVEFESAEDAAAAIEQMSRRVSSPHRIETALAWRRLRDVSLKRAAHGASGAWEVHPPGSGW